MRQPSNVLALAALAHDDRDTTMSNMPGPGDPQTWGAPTRHSNDPRTPDAEDCPTCGDTMYDATLCHGCGYNAADDIEPDDDFDPGLSYGSTRR